jgi:hypothetical protein
VLQKKFTISDSFIRGGEFAFEGAGEISHPRNVCRL